MSVKELPSKLSKFEPAIAAVLARGLPKDVAAFYAKTDGLKVSADGSTFVLVGLNDMFDGVKKGVFRKHVVAKKQDLDELDYLSLPHYERFFNEGNDVDNKKSLESLNLRMRLKLLASVEGESTELGIDFYDGAPKIYLVDRGDSAYELKGLSFANFVAWFSKFGTRRWYFAFLDKKAGEALNIDVRAELEKSLAGFPAEDWKDLLARLPKPKAAAAQRVATTPVKKSAIDAEDFPTLGKDPLVVDVKDTAREVSFGNGGHTLLVADGSYNLLAFDTGNRKQTWQQKGAYRFAVSPDGTTVAVLEHKAVQEPAERLVLRDVATGEALHAKPWKPGGWLAEVGWAGPGRVVVADHTDTLHVVDATSLTETKTIAKQKNTRALTSAGPSRVLVWSQKDDSGTLKGPSAVTLLDVDTGKAITSWKGASTAAASPDGETYALRFLDKKSEVRLVSGDRVIAKVPIGSPGPEDNAAFGYHLAFSDDGALLALSERTYSKQRPEAPSTLAVFDAKTGAAIGRVDLGADPARPSNTVDAEGLTISRDRIVCIGARSFGLRLWRV